MLDEFFLWKIPSIFQFLHKYKWEYVISARFIHNSSNRIHIWDEYTFWHFSISVSWYSSVSWLSYNQFTTRISTRNLVGKYSRVRPVHVKFFQGCEKSLARHEYSDKRVYLYTFLARYLLVNYREKARSVLKYRVVSSSVFFHIFFIF